MALEAENAIPLRTDEVDKSAANLFQGLSLAGAVAADVPKLIREALNDKVARVIDCFRQLDDDASGTIDGPEFAKGLAEMGLTAPPEAVAVVEPALAS